MERPPWVQLEISDLTSVFKATPAYAKPGGFKSPLDELVDCFAEQLLPKSCLCIPCSSGRTRETIVLVFKVFNGVQSPNHFDFAKLVKMIASIIVKGFVACFVTPVGTVSFEFMRFSSAVCPPRPPLSIRRDSTP